MGKLLGNVKNTYSRKKERKPLGKAKTNFNINVYNLSVTNIFLIPGNQTKQESSNSETDTFDQLLRGPIYNARNQSSSLSGNGNKFFSNRQETVTFYKSDAELSVSTEISKLPLFKDSKDSDTYSPSSWPSPAPYCKVKNKLVKLQKEPKITINKKQSNRIEKKHPVRKRNKPLTNFKYGSCTSSTPTRNTSLNKDVWHVSPIMPPQDNFKINLVPEDISATEAKQMIAKQNSVLGVTALIEGIGNLGIKTPHHKKLASVVNHAEPEPELFDYTSPIRAPSNGNSEEQDGHSCHKSDSEKLYKKLDMENCGGMNVSQVDALNSQKDLKSEISIESRVSFIQPNQRIEDEGCVEGLEPVHLACHSSLLALISNENPKSDQDISEGSVTSSPCSNDQHQEGLLENLEESLSSNSISPVILKKEILNESMEKTNSRNSSLTSWKEIDQSDSSSDAKLKSSGTERENSEKYSDNSDSISSLSVSEDKNDEYYPEEVNNSIKIEEGDRITQRYKKNSEVTYLHREKSLDDVETKEECLESHISTKDPEISNLNESHSEKSIVQKLRTYDIKPISDITNLVFRKSSKKFQECNIKKKLSFQPLVPELNETSVKVNLEVGKKWRRSLLRQKQSVSTFDRRVSMTADTLIRLIKESSFLSSATNISKLSCNMTTRLITDCILEDHELKNSSLSTLKGSPEFNFSLSKLSKVYTKRRRNYVHDMNDILEENSDHAIEKLYNETKFSEQELILEENKTSVECKSVDQTSVDQTNIYETPPFLRVKSDAISTITERKRSRRHAARSLGECSMFTDADGKSETSDEDNNFYMSCCSVLELEDDLENLNDENIQMMGRVGFLLRCEQQGPMSFTEAFPKKVLSSSRKIGEGVFGEVFMLVRPGEGRSVIKIIPLEGSQLVNGEPQKRFDEVLSELVITEELSLLRQQNFNRTSGFCELKNKFCLEGEYPPELLKQWHQFDTEKRSENECPDIFGPEQLYLALELAHAGEPVESFRFKSPKEGLAVFLQTAFTLAVAESATDFEHRDLHIGNILIQKTPKKHISYTLNGTTLECPTYGTLATIIDYTLSRMSFKGSVLFLDLEKDPELFTAEGDYQFDIYRHMRADLNHNWRDHQPKTNVRWLHYLLDKLTVFKYKQKKQLNAYRVNMDKIVQLKGIILGFYSASDLAQHLIESYSDITTLRNR